VKQARTVVPPRCQAADCGADYYFEKKSQVTLKVISPKAKLGKEKKA